LPEDPVTPFSGSSGCNHKEVLSTLQNLLGIFLPRTL
jgi:hypothetical protein